LALFKNKKRRHLAKRTQVLEQCCWRLAQQQPARVVQMLLPVLPAAQR
jgi:hypothetical protein